MKNFIYKFTLAASLCLLLTLAAAPHVAAKSAEMGDVVKLIETHYGVRHKGTPLLAKVGLGAGKMVAKRMTHYAEYGSVKFAYFDDQDFTSRANAGTGFANSLRATLHPAWASLVEVRLDADSEQTYIYTREAGKFFQVLVITIGQRDATVVQAEVAPGKLMQLLKDPDAAGKTLTDEASDDTQQ